MKKNIFAPDVRVIRFDSADIVCTSPSVYNIEGYNEDGYGGGYAPERTSIWD